MFEFFIEYETQINLVSIMGIIITFMIKDKIYLLVSLAAVFYSLLLLNTVCNIIGKGL
jgi:hypothetical protein